MDPQDVILILGIGVIGLMALNKKQNDSLFADFMESSGASEEDITSSIVTSSIVPVNDTSADASQSGGSSVASIKDFANAIFHFEGGASGNLNVRNNNPGNLKAAPDEYTGTTTVRDTNGLVIFPTLDAGWAALNAQLAKTTNENPDLTLTQFFARYLGQSDYLTPKVTDQGNPFTYADTVAKSMGVSATATLGQIFGGG